MNRGKMYEKVTKEYDIVTKTEYRSETYVFSRRYLI